MATYKITYFFVDNTYNVGWTENWYANAADPVSASATQANYPTTRLALMMDTSRMVQIRVSAVGKPRDATYIALGSNPVGLIPSATRKLAGVWDTLLCSRDIAAHTVIGRMYLRFVPGDIFTGRLYTGGSLPVAQWATPFQNFVVEVTSGGYFLKTKSGVAPVYVSCTTFGAIRRTERKLGRPFDALRGRARSSGLATPLVASPAR